MNAISRSRRVTLDLIGAAGAGDSASPKLPVIEGRESTASHCEDAQRVRFLRAVDPVPATCSAQPPSTRRSRRTTDSIAELGLPRCANSECHGLTARLAMNENGYPVFLERIDGEGSIRFHAPLGQPRNRTRPPRKAILAEMRSNSPTSSRSGNAVHTSKT